MKQLRSTIAALAAVAVTGIIAAPQAQAQDTGIIPFRAKVGVLWPSSSDTRNFSGSTNLGAEVDFSPPNLGMGKYTFSAGYFQGSKNGGKLRVIPLTVSRIFSPPNPAKGVTGNVYFGLGAGAYLVKASGGGTSDSATRLGGFAVAGYQFPSPYFVEAKYHLVGKINGNSASGLTVMAGRHF